MKSTICLALIVATSVASTLHAQGFNLRTGSWEFTMTMQGALPTEGISPAVRAQLEAEMRKPQTYTSCVTPDDLRTLNLGKADDDDDEDCTVVTSSITKASADITRQCTGDEPRTDVSHFEAPTPQSLRANISSKTAAGTSTMTITGTWTAAQCKD